MEVDGYVYELNVSQSGLEKSKLIRQWKMSTHQMTF